MSDRKINPSSIVSSKFITSAISAISQSRHLPWNHIIPMLLTALAYTTILSQHTRYAAPIYNKHHRESSTKTFRNTVLSLHILSGLSEITRWYFLTLSTGGTTRPTATPIDFLLCMVQSITALILVKHLARGFPIMTRPSYQAGSVARIVLASVALLTGSPEWQESSAKAVNAFLYTRLLIRYIGPLMKASEEDVPSQQQGVYNFAVIVGAILSLGEGPIPYIPIVYVVLVAINAALNREATVMVDQILAAEDKTMERRGSISECLRHGSLVDMPQMETSIAHTLVAAGFVERGIIPKVEAHVAPIPDDEYVGEKDHALTKILLADQKIDVAQ
ncbi:hypothetical protein E2P81_ATG12154 [Venturia nashicola]|nr:hypothetical protein E2P81_ATG12154 [Venturia nashicola]